jgi:hypothetical protein
MPTPEAERILMVDLTAMWTQAKEAVPANNREGEQCPAFFRAS